MLRPTLQIRHYANIHKNCHILTSWNKQLFVDKYATNVAQACHVKGKNLNFRRHTAECPSWIEQHVAAFWLRLIPSMTLWCRSIFSSSKSWNANLLWEEVSLPVHMGALACCPSLLYHVLLSQLLESIQILSFHYTVKLLFPCWQSGCKPSFDWWITYWVLVPWQDSIWLCSMTHNTSTLAAIHAPLFSVT